MGQSLDTVENLQGIVKQIEIDSRMFFTLESGETHLKVWHEEGLRGSGDVKVKMRRQPIYDLALYETPRTKSEILSFKLKSKSLNSLAIEPILLLTLTKNEVSILMESLSDEQMRFTCVWRH
jgi:hypothetical protein